MTLDAIVSWLGVIGILHLYATYAVRWWMNGTPYRARYLGMAAAWLPILGALIHVGIVGSHARVDNVLMELGVLCLIVAAMYHNENTWRRFYKLLGCLHDVERKD